jgi:hypothetical protein
MGMRQLRLPQSFQQVLVDNLWWLAILRLGVGAILLGALGNLAATDTKSTQILLLMFVVIALLTIPAISPLMKQKKLGWVLFFLTMPIQALGITASLIESSNLILIGAIAGAIVAGYVLLDIRSYYK